MADEANALDKIMGTTSSLESLKLTLVDAKSELTYIYVFKCKRSLSISQDASVTDTFIIPKAA